MRKLAVLGLVLMLLLVSTPVLATCDCDGPNGPTGPQNGEGPKGDCDCDCAVTLDCDCDGPD
jgi:hypothetical protein